MADFLQGWRWKMDIQSTPYHARRVEITLRKPRLDVSNSEGEPGNSAAPALATPIAGGTNTDVESAVRGLRVAEVLVEEATMDLSKNIFGATIQFQSQDYVALKIYPAGRAVVVVDPSKYHYFPNQLISEGKHTLEVPALQPVTFTSISDGSFYLYGEAKVQK